MVLFLLCHLTSAGRNCFEKKKRKSHIRWVNRYEKVSHDQMSKWHMQWTGLCWRTWSAHGGLVSVTRRESPDAARCLSGRSSGASQIPPQNVDMWWSINPSPAVRLGSRCGPLHVCSWSWRPLKATWGKHVLPWTKWRSNYWRPKDPLKKKQCRYWSTDTRVEEKSLIFDCFLWRPWVVGSTWDVRRGNVSYL